MKRFFSVNIQQGIIYLEDEEALHCSKVLRCKPGEAVEVLDGNGRLYEGIIDAVQRDAVQINRITLKKESKKNTNRLSIAICLTKNPARLEWFLEKATEIGIAQIYPLISGRTEKTGIKQERLQHIILSAAKQSGQLYFPVLHPVQKLNDIILSPEQPALRMIAHCESERMHLKNVYRKNEPALLLIGPEGDFTKEEVELALNNNYIPVSLGNSILRVETAGVVACSIVNSINFEA